MYKKCLGPFLAIFGDMKAVNCLYFLTGFLTLYPPGKREKHGTIGLDENKYKISLFRFPRIPLKGTIYSHFKGFDVSI